MKRPNIYATAASFNDKPREIEALQEQVIRPPIREAYDKQELYDYALQKGIKFAQENKIPYIDNYDY
jgi:hypothetical protein